LNNNTVTFILNRMEEQGLIAKVRDLRDQRTLRLVLTQKGEEHLKEGNKVYKESTAAIMALLNPEEIQVLIGLLNKVMEQTLNIRKSKKHT
jgi:DNA-binding MarR family transcriptional regulator